MAERSYLLFPDNGRWITELLCLLSISAAAHAISQCCPKPQYLDLAFENE